MLNSLTVEAHTNWTAMFISNSQFMLIIYLVLFYLNVIGNDSASPNCRQTEYRVGDECCPACPAGMYVNRHCTESSSTSCALCTEGTFQDGGNGREQCFSCKNCDAGLGLKVKKSCTSTSDALCEPLDGYFCSDSNRGGCMAAQRHTVCSPGQYISQTGTADKDTECLRCTYGTFSNGTSSCQPHTICESVGQKQIKPGTDSTDSECEEHGADPGLVAGIIVGVILLMALIIIIAIIQWPKIKALLYRRREKKLQREYAALADIILEMKTPEQKRKLTELAHLILEKETAEEKTKLTALAHLILEKETAEKKMKVTERIDQLETETPEKKWELTALAHLILDKEAAEKKTKLTERIAQLETETAEQERLTGYTRTGEEEN